MDKQKEQLDTLKEIRSIMERSSRFISLSGLSGVIAGVMALAGVAAGYIYLDVPLNDQGYYRFATTANGDTNAAFYKFLLVDLAIVLLVSIVTSTMLTIKKARQQSQPVWDATAKRLLINMMIPLATGAVYCLILLYHGQIAFIAPATLIFYGLALINASKYTLYDVRYLGVVEIITGLVATIAVEYGLLFWAFGFGIAHIVYGITMHFKYGR